MSNEGHTDASTNIPNYGRSENKVRFLDAASLGLISSTSRIDVNPEDNSSQFMLPDIITSVTWSEPEEDHPTDSPKEKILADYDTQEELVSEIADDDPRLLEVLDLLDDGYAGVIFTGPPGTSKSWYASQIAAKLADQDPRRVRFLQFHPSYQYEDFVEGYVPNEGGGFRLEKKHFLEMCDYAREKADGKLCIIVIDEISRCDPGRIFGEALTYIEMTKRNKAFRLASGRILSIPSNLVFLATMNPVDRSVDEVDAALERRFAKIAMEPDRQILRKFLIDNGMAETLRDGVLEFFDRLRNHRIEACKVGHAYFFSARDRESLARLWKHQLYFHLRKALRIDDASFQELSAAWKRVFREEIERGPSVTTVAPSDTTVSSTSDSTDSGGNT